jgi:DNA-binding MarR family transcriptional regulator
MKSSRWRSAQQALEQVSPGARLFYVSLYRRFESYRNPHDEICCWIKQTDLADSYYISPRTVQRYEQQLERFGLIETQRTRDGIKSRRTLIFRLPLDTTPVVAPDTTTAVAHRELDR